jgi:hypothetical protein
MKSTLAILGILFAMFTTGCGVDDDDDGGAGAESALLVGSVEQGLSPAGAPTPAGITVWVNDAPARAEVGEDLDFAVRTLPTGDVHVEVSVEGIRGSLDLDGVEAGEIIEVTIRAGQDALSISVVRRTPPAEAPVEDIGPPVHDGPIVIDGHHTVYHFAPGLYLGDVVVTGHHITLVGAPNPTCAPDGRTIIAGELRLEGHHIRVIGIETQGRVALPGKSHHVSMTTTGCDGAAWDEVHDDDRDDRHDRDDRDDRHDRD